MMTTLPETAEGWATVLEPVNGVWPLAEAYKAYCRDRLAELREVRVRGALPSNCIPCFLVAHNEMRRIPAFLAHYRRLGVGRFIVVDHKSSDATLEFLAEQPDVDVFSTTANFSRACAGQAWRTGLARQYAIGRWALSVDIDEHVVYHGMEKHNLHALVQLLVRLGRKRLYAPMIDMYPRYHPAEAQVDSGTPFEKLCPYFDPIEAGGRKFYHRGQTARGPILSGGPRPRQFTLDGRPMDAYLPKHPLSFWEEETLYCSVHHPYPYDQNLPEPSAALLHFKFLGDLIEHQREQARVGEIWGAGRYCTALADQVAQQPELSLFHSESRYYHGPESLVQEGIISRLPWPGWISSLKQRVNRVVQ